MTIYAAGVVCWREQAGEFQVALVHREKYNDWGFAKGKQDPGEELCETAVREVLEETGIKIRLGRKLSVINYKVDSGEDKEVHYWASKVTDKAVRKSKFAPNEEIAKIEWHDAKKALKLLSYPHDRALLKDVVNLHEEKELETRALIVLRHAQATPRSEWKNGESSRPLTSIGIEQSKRLISQLAAYGPKRLITSPWRRCRDTVAPYATQMKRQLIERTQLSEYSAEKNPKKSKRLVDDIFEGTQSTLICTHRPALPKVLEAIADRARLDLRPAIKAASTLEPGAFIVIRLTMEKRPKVSSIENVQASEAQPIVKGS